MSKRADKLIKNSIILLVGNLLTKGINFVMAPLFTRWLTVEDYGMFDLLSTYSMLLIPVVAMGVHHGLFRFLVDAKTKEEQNKIIVNSIILNLIGIIIYFFAIAILLLYDKEKIQMVFLLTILLIAQSCQNYVGMYLRGLKKLNIFTLTNVICTFSIMFCVAIMIKGFKLGLSGIIIGYACAYLLSAIVGIGLVKTNNNSKIDFRLLSFEFQKKILRYSLPMVPNSIAWWILNISDRIIVSKFLGVASNAILAVANKIPNLCITLFDIFQTAWVENVSEAINDDDWNAYFTNIINIVARFIISISTILVVTNFFVFRILFAEDYSFGRYLVPILAVAVIFSAMGQFLGSVFVAEYNSKKQCVTITEAGIINLVIHFILIRFIGLYAACISTLVAYIVLFIVRFIDLRKKYDVVITSRTYVTFCVLVIAVGISYIDNISVNIILLLAASFWVIFANKDIVSMVTNKVREKLSNRAIM